MSVKTKRRDLATHLGSSEDLLAEIGGRRRGTHIMRRGRIGRFRRTWDTQAPRHFPCCCCFMSPADLILPKRPLFPSANDFAIIYFFLFGGTHDFSTVRQLLFPYYRGHISVKNNRMKARKKTTSGDGLKLFESAIRIDRMQNCIKKDVAAPFLKF